MASFDTLRLELALLTAYLGKAEARDKICRTIQYGSKFLHGGEAGVAQNVDKATSQARKVFRLLKSVNDLQALLSPPPKGTPLALVLLSRIRNACMGTFLTLDGVVWLGRSGIYKNPKKTDLISKISLYCWLAATICGVVTEIGELSRLAAAAKEADKKRRRENRSLTPDDKAKLAEQSQKARERSVTLVKNAMDVVVAIGLLQLSPKTVTPRVTGAFGTITSLISCYQLYPPQPKAKAA